MNYSEEKISLLAKYEGLENIIADYLTIVEGINYNIVNKILNPKNSNDFVMYFNKMKSKLSKVVVFEASECILDRYTVVIGKDFYAMSQNPFSPNGFNQFIGSVEDGYSIQILEEQLNKKIDIFSDLVHNRDIIKAILLRIKNDIL